MRTRSRIVGLLLPLILVAGQAAADPVAPPGYPSKPIRLIVPSLPGSPPDVVARILGDRLGAALGQPLVVENRSGAIGTIGLHLVAKAPPDGYTLGVIATPFAIAASLLAQVPYDTATDLAAVTQVVWSANILVVRDSSPLSSVEELIAFARTHPGVITYASAGNGTPGHLAGELLKLRAGIDIRHVPFKGTQGGVAALLGEHADMNFAAPPAVAAYIRSGKLRPLAIASPQRFPAFPDVPTMIELGFPGFDIRDWEGFVAPAGTPKEIVAKLAKEIAGVVALRQVKERLASIGMEVTNEVGPEKFGTLIRSEIAKWNKVIKDAGIRLD